MMQITLKEFEQNLQTYLNDSLFTLIKSEERIWITGEDRDTQLDISTGII